MCNDLRQVVAVSVVHQWSCFLSLLTLSCIILKVLDACILSKNLGNILRQTTRGTAQRTMPN